MKIWQKLKGAKTSNLIFSFLLIILIALRLPTLLEHFVLEGTALKAENRKDLISNSLVSFPPLEGPSMVIYWATWCAPCKLEMNRLKKSVEAGAIPKERLFAISLFEDKDAITNFLAKTPYPFTFLEASSMDERLKITATPTTVILKGPIIRSISQGMSLIGIWWAEYLFLQGW